MPMGTSKACGDIACMAAILLRTVRNELPTAGSAFRASGSFTHFPVIMPPMHAAGVRTELLLLFARYLLQCITALPACAVRLYYRFSCRLYAVALAVRFDSVHRHAQFPGNLCISQSLSSLLDNQHFLSVCHTTSFAFHGIIGETSSNDFDGPDSQLLLQHAVHIAGQCVLLRARVAFARFLLQFITPAVFDADLAEVPEQNRYAA